MWSIGSEELNETLPKGRDGGPGKGEYWVQRLSGEDGARDGGLERLEAAGIVERGEKDDSVANTSNWRWDRTRRRANNGERNVGEREVAVLRNGDPRSHDGEIGEVYGELTVNDGGEEGDGGDGEDEGERAEER